MDFTMRGLLFDKDGTLLDFEATWGPLYRRLALRLAGGDQSRAEAMLVSGGFDPAAGRMRPGSILGAGTTADIVALWFPALSGTAFDEKVATIDAIFHQHGAVASVPVAGLHEALSALEAMGIAMGVATNDTTAAAKTALAAIGVGSHFPHVFGYDSVASPKPAPDIVHAFADRIGATPEEVAVIGDNVHDLEMARRAGAGWAIGVLTGNSREEDLAQLADAVLPSIRELPAWLYQNRK
jgi:phosphoglycolate phosphatase